MKKIIAIICFLALMTSEQISAQVVPVQGKVTLKQGDGTEIPASTKVKDGAQLQLQAGNNTWNGPIILTATSLKEGQNSMLIKQGKGTLQFTKTGDKFSNVIYKDSAGVATRLSPVPAGTQGAPRPDCKYPLPDACFGTANKNIGMCICKPNNISAGGYEISVNIPAQIVARVTGAQ